MFSTLKIVALELTAPLVVLALFASAAQADEKAHFWADSDAVQLDLVSEAEQTFSSGSNVFRCATVTGDASYEEQGPDQTATGISYENCHATSLGLSFPMTVTPETGCHFTFTAGTYTSVKGISHGSVHLCGMTIDTFNSGSPHGSKRCEIHVPAQTIDNVISRNTEIEGVMAMTIEFDEASVTQTVTDFNTLACNSHVHGAMVYAGSILAIGTSINQEYVDTTVVSSNPAPTKILLAEDTSQTLLNANGSTLICTELDGTADLPGESAEATGEEVKYSGCHVTHLGLSFSATVAMNGCHLAFDEGTLVEKGTKTEGLLGLACPGETKSITISYYTSSHPGGAKRCEIHIPEQTFEGVATYHNTTIEGVMAVTVTADALKVTETVTDFNTLGCNEHVHGTATYSGSLWWQTEDHNGAYVDLTATGSDQPSEIEIAADTTQELSGASGLLQCTELKATADLPGESAEATGEEVKYSSCHATHLGLNFPATVATNGCHLAFDEGTLVEKGTKTEGSLGIACPGETKSITISYYTTSHPGGAKRCEIHIPEQTFEGVATYHNTTIEGVMAVTVTADALKVTETVTDFNTLGCNSHVHGTATYSGSLWWRARDHNGAYVDLTATGSA